VSDYEKREKFLVHVGRYRAPAIAAHWEYLLTPMVPHHTMQPGALRYRPVEYHRMPVMGYLAVDRLSALTRADFVRLGLVMAPGPSGVLPVSERHAADFEARYCYDIHGHLSGHWLAVTAVAGLMFWLSRKRFVGSYVFLSACRRAYFSGP
jgi:hypothetical protein